MEILKREIRQPIVSGLFYPDDKQELSSRIEELLSPCTSGRAGILLCPHGTWKNAGASIAAAFASASEFNPDRILLLGPVHREKEKSRLYLSTKKYFETPLGLVSVDQKSNKKLAGSGELFSFDDSPHMEEHSLELQIPFIQTLFPDREIIPVLTGNLKRSDIKKAAAGIRRNLLKKDEKLLIVLSANLSRFGLLSETEKESLNLLKNLKMPLKNSLREMELKDEISSCGTTILTLLSDLGIDGEPHILEQSSTEVQEKGETKAVYYAGINWT